MSHYGEMQNDRGELILGLGVGSLALTTIGLMCCGLFAVVGGVMGVFAAFMGYQDLMAMKNGAMSSRGQGNTTGGMICGIIGALIGLLLTLVFVGIMVVYAGLLAGVGLDPGSF